jgi:Oxidoreductase family, NAD-binding Rossmann fold
MASMVRQSVAAGKHVFCEGPLALTPKEGVAAVDLCKSASLVFGMGHERRFEPTIAGKTVYPITGDQLGINIGRMIPAKLGNIQMRNLTLKSSIGSPGVWPAAIRFLERAGVDLTPIQTHHFPLTDAVEAFELGKQADKCIKITLHNKAT